MPDYPYLLLLEVTLTANNTGTVSYPVPQNEELELTQIFQVSTGTFNITAIRTSDGILYTNASAAVEIPDSLIQDGATSQRQFKDFPVPLKVAGGTILYVDLEDSSGAGNTVTLLLPAIRHTG